MVEYFLYMYIICVGTKLPALLKCRKLIRKVSPFFLISMVNLKKIISYLFWNVLRHNGQRDRHTHTYANQVP